MFVLFTLSAVAVWQAFCASASGRVLWWCAASVLLALAAVGTAGRTLDAAMQ